MTFFDRLWQRADILRGAGLLLALLLWLNAAVWLVEPRESLLFVFWSGNSGLMAWFRVAMAASSGAGLILAFLAARPSTARWAMVLLMPGVVWSLVDAGVVWGAGLTAVVDLDKWAWLPTSMVLAVALAAPGIVALKKAHDDAPTPPKRPWLARLVYWTVAAGLLGGLLLHHVMAMGATDYRRGAETAVVLGAAVYDDGKPSPVLRDRVMTAVRLYQKGRVERLLMTGGTGPNRFSEPAVMRDLAVANGVPAEAVILDEEGHNTAASARNMAEINRQTPLGRLLIVSNDHHLSRIRLACHRLGLACYTVPSEQPYILKREPYYVVREVAGFVHYALTFRAKPTRTDNHSPKTLPRGDLP